MSYSFEELEKYRKSSDIYLDSVNYNICRGLSEYNINEIFPLYTMEEINPTNYKFILVYKSQRSKSYKQLISKLNICNYTYEIKTINSKYLLLF
jgi:hypothetical protein